MKPILLFPTLLLLALHCTNRPNPVDTPDQASIEKFTAYFAKPALTLLVADKDIIIDNSVTVGSDSIVVQRVRWPKTDSALLSDTGWYDCHDKVNMSCYGRFRFGCVDTSADYEFPASLCVEYYYKSQTVLDTVFLDGIDRLFKSMTLSTTTKKGKFENTLNWSHACVANTHMETAYMEIAIDNGLAAAEYYLSYPNLGWLKDGESDGFEGYRYWHSAFSPDDDQFIRTTGQDLLPFIRTNICAKTYPEYDIRVSIVKNFN